MFWVPVFPGQQGYLSRPNCGMRFGLNSPELRIDILQRSAQAKPSLIRRRLVRWRGVLIIGAHGGSIYLSTMGYSSRTIRLWQVTAGSEHKLNLFLKLGHLINYSISLLVEWKQFFTG